MNDYTAPSYDALVYHAAKYLEKMSCPAVDEDILTLLSNERIMTMFSGYLLAWYDVEQAMAMYLLLAEKALSFYKDVSAQMLKGEQLWN